MQKILTAAASLAAVVLFVGAAITSPTTVPVLAVTGAVFLYLLVPAFMLMGAFARGLDTLLGMWLLFAAVAGPISGAVLVVIDPSRLTGQRSLLAVSGVVWMAMFPPLTAWVIHRWKADHYRRAPTAVQRSPERRADVATALPKSSRIQ
jgi:predicted permease